MEQSYFGTVGFVLISPTKINNPYSYAALKILNVLISIFITNNHLVVIICPTVLEAMISFTMRYRILFVHIAYIYIIIVIVSFISC